MPSTPLPVSDELDAVNTMLESIGQAPVSSLDLVGLGDVTLAHKLLLRRTRDVQLIGWRFNTDEDYELTPDVSGYLRVPDGVLRIDAMDRGTPLVRRRHPGGFWAIWNGSAKTWTFDGPVNFRITWGYPFDDLPDPARTYVALSAARAFQKRIIGSDNLDGFNAEDEQRAWQVLTREERALRDTNLFSRNPLLAATVANRRY